MFGTNQHVHWIMLQTLTADIKFIHVNKRSLISYTSIIMSCENNNITSLVTTQGVLWSEKVHSVITKLFSSLPYHIQLLTTLYNEVLMCILYIMHICSTINWPGQHCLLHWFWATLKPKQAFPPQKGVGLLQLLVQLCVPPPHVLLHDPHTQGLHPPSSTD